MTTPQGNVANYHLAKKSGGNDHMLDLMRGAMIDAGDRGKIEIIEADDDAFSFVPLQETLRRFLMTDDPDDETWTINISGAAFFPISASLMVHDAPQEVH